MAKDERSAAQREADRLKKQIAKDQARKRKAEDREDQKDGGGDHRGRGKHKKR